jgi:hypothetical protein
MKALASIQAGPPPTSGLEGASAPARHDSHDEPAHFADVLSSQAPQAVNDPTAPSAPTPSLSSAQASPPEATLVAKAPMIAKAEVPPPAGTLAPRNHVEPSAGDTVSLDRSQETSSFDAGEPQKTRAQARFGTRSHSAETPRASQHRASDALEASPPSLAPHDLTQVHSRPQQDGNAEASSPSVGAFFSALAAAACSPSAPSSDETRSAPNAAQAKTDASAETSRSALSHRRPRLEAPLAAHVPSQTRMAPPARTDTAQILAVAGSNTVAHNVDASTKSLHSPTSAQACIELASLGQEGAVPPSSPQASSSFTAFSTPIAKPAEFPVQALPTQDPSLALAKNAAVARSHEEGTTASSFSLPTVQRAPITSSLSVEPAAPARARVDTLSSLRSQGNNGSLATPGSTAGSWSGVETGAPLPAMRPGDATMSANGDPTLHSMSTLPGVASQLLSVLSPLRSSVVGTQVLSVVLHPEHLGDVRATVASNGDQVVIRLVASTSQGSAALRAALPDLREHLGDSSARTVVFLADGDGANGESQRHGGAQTRAQQQPALSTNVARSPQSTEAATTTPAVGRVEGERLLDLRL